MPQYMIPVIIIFSLLSLFQYMVVFCKLFEGDYDTKKDFLIAAIPGKFVYNAIVYTGILIKKFKELK